MTCVPISRRLCETHPLTMHSLTYLHPQSRWILVQLLRVGAHHPLSFRWWQLLKMSVPHREGLPQWAWS